MGAAPSAVAWVYPEHRDIAALAVQGLDAERKARQAWMAAHQLLAGLRYYSLATFPDPERISRALRSSTKKLGRVDARNDSQLIFYNELIPGSTLMGFINADHWAIAVPIARTHPHVGGMLVNENAFPREALLEAVMRFVEEELSTH